MSRGSNPMKADTDKIIELLQRNGEISFKEINEKMEIGHRRSYDILNVLMVTPLVSKTSKRRESKVPYLFLDGIPIEKPETISLLAESLEEEEMALGAIKDLLAAVERDAPENEIGDLVSAIKRSEKEKL